MTETKRGKEKAIRCKQPVKAKVVAYTKENR